MKCLFCDKAGFPVGPAGVALSADCLKKVLFCFSIKDQIMDLYQAMEENGMIRKEGVPSGEGIAMKRRGRPPKKKVEAAAPAAEAGKEAPEAQQPQSVVQG